jgi:hypothetical protein
MRSIALVDFGGVLETDRHRVDTTQVHGELHGRVAVFRGE